MPHPAPASSPTGRRTARRVLALFALSAAVGGAGCATAAGGAPSRSVAADRAAPPAPAALPDFAARYTTEGRELTADEQVRHALARLTFGARPGDVERVRAVGVDRWIDQQLFPERIPDPAGDAVPARYPDLARSGGELMAAYPPPGQLLVARTLRAQAAARATGDTAMDGAAMLRQSAANLSSADSARLLGMRRASYRFVGELQAARVGRAVASERQLQEVMTDFWENHFNVFAAKDRLRYFLPEYDAAVRARAMGRFRDLLGAVAHSPAMLYYLDNWQSVADSTRPTLAQARQRRARPALNANGKVPKPRARRGLNENYARELMELHTLGVDGGYTQQDVTEVARALTGWSVRLPALGGGFVFRPEAHDAGAKTILGQRFPAGGGVEEGERVLDLVARHPSTARFVARKLAVRFVSDSPPPALVDRAADAFRRTDGDVRATLAVILHSPEFFSRAAYKGKVKTPFELVASAARALGAAPDTTPRTAQLVARLGQPLWGHQAPDGWPETGEPWVNTGSILNRINFGSAVAAGRVPGVRLQAWPAYAALRAAPRDRQIDGVVAALLGGEASPDTRAILARGENPLAARATAQAAQSSEDDPSADGGMMAGSAMASEGGDAPGRRRANRRLAPGREAAQAAREAVKPGRMVSPFAGPALRPLDPFAQLVGLALGAPEFQRR